MYFNLSSFLSLPFIALDGFGHEANVALARYICLGALDSQGEFHVNNELARISRSFALFQNLRNLWIPFPLKVFALKFTVLGLYEVYDLEKELAANPAAREGGKSTGKGSKVVRQQIADTKEAALEKRRTIVAERLSITNAESAESAALSYMDLLKFCVI